MNTIAFEELEQGGLNAPVTEFESTDEPNFSNATGCSRYRSAFEGGESLDALLVNKGSDVLVVTLHGAVDRTKTEIPRFERVRSMLDLPVSSMYFGDPALWRNEIIQLAWFTGWQDVDVHQIIADWSRRAAAAVGAKKIIFTGSSGGGFASLQISSLVPGSVALAFNPQTSIFGYLADNYSWGPQKYYLKTNWPELIPTGGLDKLNLFEDWTLAVDTRVSALRKYSAEVDNYVLFVINKNEFHYEKHFLPFMGACAIGGNLDRVHTKIYDGGIRHNPPTPDVFKESLDWAFGFVNNLGQGPASQA